MTTLTNPATGQPCEFVRAERGYVCLRTTCITPAVRWFPLSAIEAANPPATCAEPPKVECTAIVVWRPTIELPITELGFYREGSKQKAVPGVQLHQSNVRIVLTMPVAA